MTGSRPITENMPTKPLTEIGDVQRAEIKAKSFGREILHAEGVWVPSSLDKEEFVKLRDNNHGAWAD